MVLPDSNGIPRAPSYSGARSRTIKCISLTRLSRSMARFSNLFSYTSINPGVTAVTPKQVPQPLKSIARQGTKLNRFGLFPVRSPLLGESRVISFPEGTEMFQFPSFALHDYVFIMQCTSITRYRFSHSEIHGSKLS